MRQRLSRIFLALYDTVAAVTALVIAAELCSDGNMAADTLLMLSAYMVLILGVVLLVNYCMGSYYSVWKYAGFAELIRCFLNTGLIGAFLFLFHAIGVIRLSTSVLFVFMMTFLLLTLPSRFFSRFYRWLSVRIKLNKTNPAQNALIVGGGNAGAALIERMFNTPDDNLCPVVVIDDDPMKKDQFIHGLKVVGGRENIPEAVLKYCVDVIIIAIPSIGGEELRIIYDICSKCRIPVKILPNIMSFHDYINIGKNALREISLEDLLFRDEVHLEDCEIKSFLTGKTVIVTGGAGSIGSEICRQALCCGCGHLVIFDFSENGLYEIKNELKERYAPERFTTVLGTVRDIAKLESVFEKYKPDIVLHAAAHKHVPLMEENPIEAIKNNVFGTYNVIRASMANQVKKLILISTDKAVNTVNVMGATKRFAEILLQAYNGQQTVMAAVRFGNVLGSAGSVIPLFRKQIAQGGPVTVTHPDMKRYFMTIPEAVALVLQTGALTQNGGIFILDMGKPIRICDLASDLIKLSGLRPNKDIQIEYTGIRPGEKLFEELSFSSEDFDTTTHRKIFVCRGARPCVDKVEHDLEILRDLIRDENESAVSDTILNLIGSYSENLHVKTEKLVN